MISTTYPVLLLCVCLSWMLLFPIQGDHELRGTTSFVLLQVLWILAYVLLDSLTRSSLVRFFLGGLAALGAIYIAFDAYLLWAVSFSLIESLTMLIEGGDFLATLAETGMSPLELAGVIATATGVFVAGGVLQAKMSRLGWPSRRIVLTILILFLLPSFVAEQYLARNRWDYGRRERLYPGYLCLFAPEGRSQALRTVVPDLERRVRALPKIGTPRNPKDVVIVLLESVASDLFDPAIAPRLSSLADESLRFHNAYADGIWTVLTWTVLLLDHPSHTWDWSSQAWKGEAGAVGSWPIAVLHRAGYRTKAAFGMQLDWKRFRKLFEGDGTRIDALHLPQMKATSANPAGAFAEADRRAVDAARSWIEKTPSSERLFLLLQLGSTHWPYEFDPAEVWTSSYPEQADPRQITSHEGLEGLHNRYLNSVHYVDGLVGEILDSLRSAGRYDDTAIVVLSDHGESFTLGRVAHASLNSESKRIPFIMRLPGVAAEDVDTLVAQRDLYPTLFDYLEIEGLDPRLSLGRTALPGRPARRAVLTMGGANKMADLTFSEAVVRFRIDYASRREQTWTAVDVFDRENREVADPEAMLRRLPWRTALGELIGDAGR